MAHPLVAAVWEQLGRRDLENIIHEIIGQHAASLAVSSAKNGHATGMESLTQPVLWIQTLFNFQRTYLQGLTSSQDCHPYFAPYLLSSDIVLSALMYLTKVKTDLFPCLKPTAPDLGRYRHLIGHTLLVGIRVLVLRGEAMSSETKFSLERTMRSAWEHPDLSKSESFLINDLLPKAIASIGSSDIYQRQHSMLKASKAYIPDFSSGIYPFPGAPDTLVTDLLTALTKKGDELLPSFYLLYDLLWAAESAIIQCHIDRRRISQEKGYTSEPALKVDEAFSQTQDNRKKLARTILAAFDGENANPSLQVLATVILSQTAGENAPLQTRRIRDSWSQLASLRESTDSALGLLMRWLVNRRVQLWDCNGELESFSHDYQQHLTEWLQSSFCPSSRNAYQTKKGGTGAVYVVNCPAAHPIPGASLGEQLKVSDTKAYGQLQEKPRLLTVDMTCPRCPGNIKIQHARMVGTPEHASDALLGDSESSGRQSLPDSASRPTTSRSSSRTNSTDQLTRVNSSEGKKSPVSPISQSVSFFKLSSRSSSPSMSDISGPIMSRPRTSQPQDKQLIRSLSKDLKNVTLSLTGSTSLFRKNSAKGRNLPRQPRFCFSSSGQCLLLWDEGSNSVMRFEINSASMDGRKIRGHRYDVPGLQFAAAGNNRCAAIAAVAEHYEFLVFRNNGANPEAYSTIEVPQLSSSIHCMVMSRDDRYVAFTLNDQVRVYEIGASDIRQVTLGGKADYYAEQNIAVEPSTSGSPEIGSRRSEAVIARKIQFSVDGKRFIVATRLGDQYAYVDVWNCVEHQWKLEPGGSKSFKLPAWTSEEGDLTCVFYDSFNETVILTAFLSKEYPVSFSLSGESFTSDPVSPRIVHAAQSPSGSRFILANGMKQMYLCDSNASGSLIPTKMKKAISKISPAAFRPGHLALSFPGENEVYAFWAKDGKLMLRTVSLHAGNEAVSDYDLRAEFDRLVVERPVAVDFQRPRHQPSSLSRQVESDIEGLSLPNTGLPLSITKEIS